MSEMANVLGVPREFTHHGKTVRVAARNLETEAAFAVWCEEQGLKAIQRHQANLSIAEYDLLLTSWRRDCQRGAYDWGEHLSWQMVMSDPGKKQIWALQIVQATGGRVSEALRFVAEVWKDNAARKRLEAVLDEVNADPTTTEPAPATAGPSAGTPSAPSLSAPVTSGTASAS